MEVSAASEKNGNLFLLKIQEPEYLFNALQVRTDRAQKADAKHMKVNGF